MDSNNFQRVGSLSNARERNPWPLKYAQTASSNSLPTRGFKISVGVGNTKKPRKFDLGSDNPPILVECKSHAWTVGGNIPSAKMTVRNEAMYYFHMAPGSYRKVLFTLRSMRADTSLAAHYVKLRPSDSVWRGDLGI